MALVTAHKHSYLEVVVAGFGTITTVSAGPDDGANQYVSCSFWKAMRHDSTKRAIDNFLSKVPRDLADVSDDDQDILRKGTGQLNICGHGSDGFLTTGIGQKGSFDPTKSMAIWNEHMWGPELDRLKGVSFTVLTIWSCHTGAGEDGADFLYAVAKRIARPVCGNTGFLYSNSKCKVWREIGSQWQVATPDHRPPAIPSPTPHFLFSHDKEVAFEGDEMIDPHKSKKLTLSRRDIADSQKNFEVGVPEQAQRQIIIDLARSVEIELPGHHLGYQSHTLAIDQTSGRQLEFGIVNGRMIVDRDGQKGIIVPPSLRAFL